MRVITLMTDIGNDIMYSVPAEEIVACLKKIFAELRDLKADILVSPIHVDFKNDLTEAQFTRMRSIFFPKSNVGFQEASQAVDRINHFLYDAEEDGIIVLPNTKKFCGGDKIHYSLLKSHGAWSLVAEQILGVLNITPKTKITWVQTTRSLFINFIRLTFVGILKVCRAGKGTY